MQLSNIRVQEVELSTPLNAEQVNRLGRPLKSNVERQLPGVEFSKSKDRTRCTADFRLPVAMQRGEARVALIIPIPTMPVMPMASKAGTRGFQHPAAQHAGRKATVRRYPPTVNRQRAASAAARRQPPRPPAHAPRCDEF